MAGDPGSRRVLVVDDAADMRAVICRVLAARGYRVDAVGTLAEARAMTPREYDAILVDMRLGSERGTTLIAELMAADAGLASRCLLMSGGAEHIIPGVATLAKPFLPGQLLDAVRALRGTEPEAAGSAQPEDGPDAPAPTTATATAREPAAAAGPAVTLLGMSGSLRARERAEVADALHDGPVQDLATAILGLYLIREQLPAAQSELLDSVTAQISDAAMSVRGLMGRCSPRWPGESPAETIGNQAAWLLDAPPVVEIRPPADRMSQETAQFTASVAELALFLASGSPASGGRLPDARIRVLTTEQTMDIEVTIGWPEGAPGDAADRDAADRDAAEAAWLESLRGELASALGAGIDVAWGRGELRMRVSLYGI